MKKLIIALALMCTHIALMAQTNLVPNGRFEEKVRPDTCSNQYGLFDYVFYQKTHQVKDWWLAAGIAFFMCGCDTGTTYHGHAYYGVPYNGAGIAPDADSGDAYLNLFVFNASDSFHTASAVGTTLTHSLKRGHHCEFRAKVRVGANSYDRSNLYICLEKYKILPDSSLLYVYEPSHMEDIFSYDSLILNCDVWKEIRIPFIASKDSLRYLIVGGFPTVHLPMHAIVSDSSEGCLPVEVRDGDAAYLFLDDVRLYDLDSGVGISEVGAEQAEVTVFPNPVQGKISIKCNEAIDSWQLFDLEGRQVFQANINQRAQELEIPESIEQGMYFWEAKEKGQLMARGRVLKE
jgi:Secretion system C-terminal sorting domain